MLEVVTTQHNVQALYVGPTLNQARGAVWLELVEWSKPYGGVPHDSRMEIFFPATKSLIRVMAAETKKLIDRIRSQKRVAYVAWDEMAMYQSEFAAYGVSSVIRPALADVKGRLVLIGTGGPEDGFWHEVVTQPERGYAVSKATIWDNPTIDDPDEEVDGACKDRGVTRQDPYIRREWGSPEKGIEFTTDSERSVFPRIVAKPFDLLPGGSFLIGGDVGSADLSAAVVYWLHPHHPGMVMVESEKRKTEGASDQIALFRHYAEKYQRISSERVLIAIDPGGGGSGVIKDLARLGGFFEVMPAQKFDKPINVRLMADDIRTGFLTVLPGNQHAVDGLHALEWEPGKEGSKLRGHADDAADGALYGWRLARQLYDYSPPAEPSANPDLELMFAQQEAEEERLRDLGYL